MGNTASSLPYSIGKQVATVNDGWTLHEGSQKSDGSAVTVFVAKKPALTKTAIDKTGRNAGFTQLAPAMHHFTQCKKLRHPHILNVHATLDTDHPTDASHSGGGGSGGGAGAPHHAPSSSATETGDLIIVTEPCRTLDAWLQTQNPSPEQVAWGLESMIRALHFLHASANLVHGNLSPSSFYVTLAGDVKLWNFSLVSAIGANQGGVPNYFRDYEGLLTPQPYRSPERQEGRWDAVGTVGIHAMDSYGLGVLIGHLYGNRVPPQLVKAVQRLLTTNLKMRPRLQPLLKCPIFDTPHQKLQLQLEELSVQPVEQKVAFWQNLHAALPHVPEAMAVYKLLPLMKQSIATICQNESMRGQTMYRREVLAIIPPLLFIAEQYLGDKLSEELTETIALLFAVNDRGIRGALLQKAPLLADKLDKNSLNHSVFEPMCSGFSDSSAALRELTLKATLVLVPNLSQPNLEKLSRYLIRLQGDSEASIRTNTVIFFAKLAPHLTETTRQKQLLPAFTRAMKDPFTPCRLAALQSVLKCKDLFDAQSVAGKLLPVVTPNLLDPAMEVRKQSFAVVDDLLFYLRQESERMPPDPVTAATSATAGTASALAPAPAARAPAAKSAAAPPAAPTSGGYLSGISSWMTTSSSHAPAPSTAPPPMNVTAQPVQPPPNISGLNVSNSSRSASAADGWGDDDSLGISSGRGSSHQPVGSTNVGRGSLIGAAPAAASAQNAWNEDDDFFESFDAKPAKPASIMPASGGKTAPPKTPAAAAMKLEADDFGGDGWDDF